jgi:hypothetical protein
MGPGRCPDSTQEATRVHGESGGGRNVRLDLNPTDVLPTAMRAFERKPWWMTRIRERSKIDGPAA